MILVFANVNGPIHAVQEKDNSILIGDINSAASVLGIVKQSLRPARFLSKDVVCPAICHDCDSGC